MERKQYEATRKQVLRDNRIILGARGASWIFWFLAVMFICLIVIALWWLLTQPTPTQAAQQKRTPAFLGAGALLDPLKRLVVN